MKGGRAAFFLMTTMKAKKIPDRDSLHAEYEKFLPARLHAIKDLEIRIEEVLSSLASHSRVKGRVKSFNSSFKKFIRKYKPRAGFYKINDLIGIRVVCHFLEDLAAAEELIKKSFDVIEVEHKGGDHTYREFGYESIHLMIVIPDDIVKKYGIPDGETAEIQIRTILQDAWAEVEHELIYKAEFTPFDDPLRRKLAAVNASLSLADIIFQEIRSYQRELNGELGKRRHSFFRKIEETTDAVLFLKDSDAGILPEVLPDTQTEALPSYTAPDNVSVDELLLEALSAHNKKQFPEAIAIYTYILEMKLSDNIRSIIYQHRGMAYFARSHYGEAIVDFNNALKLEPKSYKAAYYEGIVCSVLTRYSEAADAFTKSLEINPYQPYCLFRRGQAFFHLEDFPRALGDCEAALALEPLEAVKKFKDLVMTKLKM